MICRITQKLIYDLYQYVSPGIPKGCLPLYTESWFDTFDGLAARGTSEYNYSEVLVKARELFPEYSFNLGTTESSSEYRYYLTFEKK
jgi:hypothetical protein